LKLFPGRISFATGDELRTERGDMEEVGIIVDCRVPVKVIVVDRHGECLNAEMLGVMPVSVPLQGEKRMGTKKQDN
jgi:hypothetical protein